MELASVLVTGYLRTQEIEKARKILKKLASILELDFADAEVGRYDAEFSRFHCKLEVSVESQRDAYFDFLERFGRIASGRLSVSAPHKGDETHWDFDVAVPTTSVPGVNSIELSVVFPSKTEQS